MYVDDIGLELSPQQSDALARLGVKLNVTESKALLEPSTENPNSFTSDTLRLAVRQPEGRVLLVLLERDGNDEWSARVVMDANERRQLAPPPQAAVANEEPAPATE